jgi:DNA-3-methyladenine glycosylase
MAVACPNLQISMQKCENVRMVILDGLSAEHAAIRSANPRRLQETNIDSDTSRVLNSPVERISRHNVPSDTIALARFLLGKVVVREFDGGAAAGRIVETEAYLQHDAACHAYRGMTPRNRSLFLEHGRAYVYLCYGTSFMLNVSSEAAGTGSGVLLRALEPLYGIEHMQRSTKSLKVANLARGPGRLASALRVDRRHDGLDLFAGEQLWIGSDGHSVGSVGQSTRIGLTKAADERLRYFVVGSPSLSGPRKLNLPPVEG